MTGSAPPHEAAPRLERAGDAVYLVDRAGERWRVHWVCYGPPLAAPFKHKRLGVADRRANYLYFVRADKHTRIHRLDRESDRSITAEVLAAYLARAGVPAVPHEPPPSRGLLGS